MAPAHNSPGGEDANHGERLIFSLTHDCAPKSVRWFRRTAYRLIHLLALAGIPNVPQTYLTRSDDLKAGSQKAKVGHDVPKISWKA